jgi:hypothetical protein
MANPGKIVKIITGNLLGLVFGLGFVLWMLGGSNERPTAGRAGEISRANTPTAVSTWPAATPPTTTPPATATPRPRPTATSPKRYPTATPTSAAAQRDPLPQPGATHCPPGKCHVQGFTGGLLVSTHGKTFGLFNSGQWLVEEISEQEAAAVEHFDCPGKPLDPRVKWGFNVAYCRFYARGLTLGDPIDAGGSLEGEVFRPTSQGLEVDLKGWYGLNQMRVNHDGSWEFGAYPEEAPPASEAQPPQSQEAFIIFDPDKNVFAFGEQVSMCFYLNFPAPARATIHNPARDVPIVFEWPGLGPGGECVVGPMAAGHGHNRLVLEVLDGSAVSTSFEFDVY